MIVKFFLKYELLINELKYSSFNFKSKFFVPENIFKNKLYESFLIIPSKSF